jgi:hypothetical protein
MVREVILPAFKRQYPLAYASGLPGWVVSYDTDADAGGRTVNYTLTAEALTEPLPVGADGTGEAVDGALTVALDGEAGTGRVVSTVTFEGTVTGDPWAVVATIRSGASARGVLARESVRVTRTKGVRVSSVMTFVSSEDGAESRVLE